MKVKVKSIAENGKIILYNLIGRVRRALKRAGQRKEAEEFYAKAQSCEDLDAVLRLVKEYADIY